MSHDRYMMLTGIGHALRCDPESRVRSIQPMEDKDGFEAVEVEFEGGYRRGMEITCKSTPDILRLIATAIEGKETLYQTMIR